jgi:hypothetical protein
VGVPEEERGGGGSANGEDASGMKRKRPFRMEDMNAKDRTKIPSLLELPYAISISKLLTHFAIDESRADPGNAQL